MSFLDTAPNKIILTEISTMLVRDTTSTVSKKVKRFLWVGRVVMKKLTRATQEKLEAVKESRQRNNFTAAAIPPTYLIQSFGLVLGPDFLPFCQTLNVINQGIELMFAGFSTLVIL